MSPGAGRAARRPPALIGRALALGLSATILGACAGATPGLSLDTTAPSGAAERISATVVRPEGAGPFPAVVVMHDCGGLGSRSSGAPDRWARELVARGYAMLMADSSTTRGFPDGVCTTAATRGVDVSLEPRARRPRGAGLPAQPWVDGRRVGIMGGSHGGTTTLATMQPPRAISPRWPPSAAGASPPRSRSTRAA